MRDNSSNIPVEHPRLQAVLQVLWPGFFASAVLVGLLFSLIDPVNVDVVIERLDGSREAAYTIVFIVIWMVVSSACATTRLLSSK